MDIRERTSELHNRLLGLIQRRAGYDEGKELDDFRSIEIDPRATRLKNLKVTRSVFAQRTISIAQNEIPGTLLTEVKNLRSRFGKAPSKATLVAKNNWPSVTPALDHYLAAAEKNAIDVWGAYCLAQSPSDSPFGLREDTVVMRHPGNLPVLLKYENLWRLLARGSSMVPRTVEDVDEFIERAQKAHELLGQIRRDMPTPQPTVPPNVQRFLAATKIGPVKPDQLTNEVMEWLKASNRLGEFEVRRKVS